MLNIELETAIRLAHLAGEKIMEFYSNGFVAEEKTGADNFSEPVTIADRTASEIIVAGLLERFPNDGILSEELPDNDDRLSKERVWIIDPLDGTKGFIEGNGDFAVQIGLAENGKCVLGVVFLPFYDQLYYGSPGNGAFLVSGTENKVKLETSNAIDFNKMLLASSRNHRSRNMNRVIEGFGLKGEVNRGSVGLKIGLIASQICDLYVHFSPRTKHWDTCAPEAIIKEAGGNLTDIFGDAIVYNTKDVLNHNGILASCGQTAHNKSIESLKPLLVEFGRKNINSK